MDIYGRLVIVVPSLALQLHIPYAPCYMHAWNEVRVMV